MITLTAVKANTRGKGTREITYNGIGKLKIDQVPVKDEVTGKTVKKDGKAVTEPKESLDTSEAEKTITLKELFELGKGDEKNVVRWAIDGYNNEALKLASDQLAAYIDSSWPAETVAAFRLAANNLIKLDASKFDEAIKFATMFATSSLAK